MEVLSITAKLFFNYCVHHLFSLGVNGLELYLEIDGSTVKLMEVVMSRHWAWMAVRPPHFIPTNAPLLFSLTGEINCPILLRLAAS